MSKFIIRNRSVLVIRLLLGILITISSISCIVRFSETHNLMELGYFTVMLSAGIFTVINGFKVENAEIDEVFGGIRIKWVNWLFKKQIYYVLIEQITLGRESVVINLYGRKPVRLKIESFGPLQREKIYRYFIEYSSLYNIKLARSF